MKIGFIGLGNLGTPIAQNLLAKHDGMYVYNRTIEKAKPLQENGAQVCNSVKELAAQCDTVFTIISNDAAVKEITSGDEGIAKNLKHGGIHVSMSTILPATSEEMYALHKGAGNMYIACPVAGRPEAARDKKLNFMISGEADTVSIVKPLLMDAGGVNVWEYGTETGGANVAKLCTNYLIQAALQSMSESIYLAEKSGIDKQQLMKMLTSTLFNCGIYINYGNMVLNEAFTPAGFELELGLKDATLIKKQAETVGAKMPLGNLIQQEYQQLFMDGYKDYDWSALALSVK